LRRVLFPFVRLNPHPCEGKQSLRRGRPGWGSDQAKQKGHAGRAPLLRPIWLRQPLLITMNRHNTQSYRCLFATVSRSVGGLPAPVYCDTSIGGNCTGHGGAGWHTLIFRFTPALGATARLRPYCRVNLLSRGGTFASSPTCVGHALRPLFSCSLVAIVPQAGCTVNTCRAYRNAFTTDFIPARPKAKHPARGRAFVWVPSNACGASNPAERGASSQRIRPASLFADSLPIR